MPQNIGMGGIAVATNSIGGFNSINIINPASYARIGMTTIDAGVSTNMLTLSKTGLPDERNVTSSISHIAFALPITRRSAISFGLVPYSDLGYSYKQIQSKGYLSPTDTNVVNHVYSGTGGLSKTYIGYGFGIGKHLMIGANVSYIFGSLKETQSTEIPKLYGTLDSRIEQSNHVGGINFDYGVQYAIDLSSTSHVTLGYSGSANSKLNTQNSFIVSQYTYDATGHQNLPADSVVSTNSPNAKLQLPQINRFGIAFQKDGRFLIGADYTMGNWSTLSIAGTNQGLVNSQTLNVGGQITPNSNSLSNYFALIDYRLGVIYEKTYLNPENINLKRYALTFGLGIPLSHDRASSAFYKVNFSTEIGRRGTMDNGLIQEHYVNFHLAFLLNDRWFQRFKFD